MFMLRYLLLCCAMATVLAHDNTEKQLRIVWVLIGLLFIIVIPMAIGVLFVGYHYHQRFKKIEFQFSRSGSMRSSKYNSRRSSKRSNVSARYENNPIHRKWSQSPNTSPLPGSLPRQQNGISDHVAVPMDTIYPHSQNPNQHYDSNQHYEISYSNAMGHYETLAMDAGNDSVTMSEEEAQYEEQEQQEAKPTVTGADNAHQQKTDNTNEVAVIEASYTTSLPERTFTVTNRVSDGNGNVVEYSDVVNPSPSTNSKSEHVKMNGTRKGKKPDSSEEYTDPIQNGMANMRRLKATKSQDSPPEATSKQRRASEPGVHRNRDFEDWPLKSHAPTESDL